MSPGEPVLDPAALRAERECLGLAMRSPGALAEVLAELAPEDYARPAHAILHQALMELHLAGEPTGEASVVAWLAHRAHLPGDPPPADPGRVPTLLDRCGGALYAHGLVEDSGGAGACGYHVAAVAEASRRRDVAEAAARAAQVAADAGADAGDVERELRGALERLAQRPSGRWREPLPLVPPLPPFPVHVLPGVLRRAVTAVAEATQTPPDLAAFAALAAVSAAARGSWEVRVQGAWREVACLYLTALSDSGTRKSAVLSALDRPLRALAGAPAEAEQYAVRAADHEILTRRYKAALDRASRAESRDEVALATGEAQELAISLANTPEPSRLQILGDDVTAETLGVLMQRQGGPLAVLTDEGGLLGTWAGRYAAQGGANIDLVLKAFNGTHYRCDRISRDSVEVPRPVLTLGFVVQPDVIAEALRVKAFTERGLLPRMLFALPASTLGTRELDPPDVPPEVDAEWSAVLVKIFHAGRDAMTGGSPGVVLLDAGAKAAFDTWRGPDGGHESRLGRGGDLADMAPWASKLPGALVRVAAMLALTERPGDAHPRVTGAEMRAALGLADYLVAHARAVLGHGSGQAEQLKAVLAWVRRAAAKQAGGGEVVLTPRQVFHGVHGQAWVRRVEDVDDVLGHLEELGYVRRVPPGPSRGGRPPGARYVVNPRFLSGT